MHYCGTACMTAQAPPRPITSGMPLLLAPTGRPVTVRGILGGRGIHQRLSALGIHPGVEVMVISASPEGPCIIAIQDSRFALGRGMAHQILVD